ncbi:MAG: hypothetical protein ACNS60_17445 [Candidatus Cyclobacteriaceae bacterium M2_1C_046]
MANELKGKNLYAKEEKIGEIVDVKKDPFKGEHEVAIVKTGMNNYKAAPVLYLQSIQDRCEFRRDPALIENFPKMSMRDFEDEKQFQNNLTENYGKPDYWSSNERMDSDKNDRYMGSSQTTNQATSGNTTLKDEMDYDDLKHPDRDK